MKYTRLTLAFVPPVMALIAVLSNASPVPALDTQDMSWSAPDQIASLPFMNADLSSAAPDPTLSPTIQTAGALGNNLPQLAADTVTPLDTTSADAPANNQASTGNSSPVTIQIMEHVCGPQVRNDTDFFNLGQGLDSLSAFAREEAACPTTILPNNTPTANATSAPQMTFDYTIEDANNSKTLADSTFTQAKVCETDLKKDIDNDGTISPSTCVDASHYDVGVNGPNVHITETTPPDGYIFGRAVFTPTQLSPNNDVDALVSATSSPDGTGTIDLNTASDTDHMIMLHVFQYPTPSTPGTQPSSSGLDAFNTPSDSNTGPASDTNNAPGETPTSGIDGAYQAYNMGKIRDLLQEVLQLQEQIYRMLSQQNFQ